jgi:glycosyltransferase involved in cell wall biosynthesis
VVDYFCTPASLEQAHEHLSRGGYDLLVADEICMTPYVEMIPDRPRIIFRQKVDYLHYREVARARPWGTDKILEFMESVKLQRYERARMGLYQGYVACSEGDAALICRYAPGIPYIVIPNGVDLSAFVPSGRPKASQPTLLYVGSMYYPPNVDAVQFFFQSIYPSIREAQPGIRVQIVGHMPPPEVRQWERLPSVEVTGGVPDVRPYYEEATVFIVPLRLGGGTRLKIPEAMAMGLPVVSTRIGAEGLDIQPGENILIADDPVSFARSVLQLLSDPELRERIAAGGRRLAQRYDWKELTRPLPDWILSVMDNWRQRRSDAHSTAC